jgi:thymidylate synthase (FAD)
MKVSLISATPGAEKTVMYCARVSSPNQDSDNPKLLSYCIKHGHWSVFEQASMTVEIQTSRAISAQILRHRSFSFQEFSQRYSEVTSFETYEARRQDVKNRQNSVDDMSEEDKRWFVETQHIVQEQCERLYNHALRRGIAKEQARMLLPMSASTKLYMTGNLRSFMHYIQLRTEAGTQLEHRVIAEEIKRLFMEQFPIISEALGWTK